MASWEDGPEYAPLVRPDHFDLPEDGSLDDPAPKTEPMPTAPPERPRFSEPAAPVVELAALVPSQGAGRDPAAPFDVVTSTMTATDSAWSAAHWSPPAGPTPAPLPGPPPAPTPTWSPPPATTWTPPPPPSGPLGGPSGPPANFPAPGTPQWFSPWSAPPPPVIQPVTFRRVLEAATPGLCITLAIGGLVYVLAPITLLVAFGLSPRVKVANRAVRQTFTIGVGVLGFVSTISALTTLLDGNGFGEWWGTVGIWALLTSWVVLIVTLLQVARGLSAPPSGAEWR